MGSENRDGHSANEHASIQGKKNHDSLKQRLIIRIKRVRQVSFDIVNHHTVQMTILFLIVINSIFMGIATFDFITENEFNSETFEAIDTLFLSIFTFELILQFVAVGFRLFLDGWLFLDFFVVMISWIGDIGGVKFQIMRSFRIFRSLRLITRVKMMKELVTALLTSLPSMSAIIVFMLIIVYIFAVMLTDLYKNIGEEEGHDIDPDLLLHFRTLGASFFTLFQITTLDGWATITREFMKYHVFAWVILVSFVVISGIVVMNLIIAVICDSLQRVENDKKGNECEEKSTAEKSMSGDSQSLTHGLTSQLDAVCSDLEDIKQDHESILYTIELIVKGMQYHKEIPKKKNQGKRRKTHRSISIDPT